MAPLETKLVFLESYLLMVEKSQTTTWDGAKTLLNNGMNYQAQLVNAGFLNQLTVFCTCMIMGGRVWCWYCPARKGLGDRKGRPLHLYESGPFLELWKNHYDNICTKTSK